MFIKQLLWSLSIFVIGSIALPAFAYASNSTTDVSGKITINGTIVASASVVVICNNHSQSTYTDSKGAYTVKFSSKDCPNGTKATVVATQNNLGGVTSGPITTGATAALSVDIINTSVPEFGVIAGFISTIAAAVIFLISRHHKLEI